MTTSMRHTTQGAVHAAADELIKAFHQSTVHPTKTEFTEVHTGTDALFQTKTPADCRFIKQSTGVNHAKIEADNYSPRR